MNESFVLHAEYIEDLPEECKKDFLAYIYDYGIHGIVPELKGLERTIWVKIQRRIDADRQSWEETKQSRSTAGKIGGLKSAQSRASKTKQNEAPLQTSEANEAMLQMVEANKATLELASNASSKTKQAEANEAVSVYVSDNVNVSVSESGSVSESEKETEPIQTIEPVNTDTKPSLQSPAPLTDVSQLQNKLYNLVETHNKNSPIESRIPISSNIVSFIQKECRDLLTVMRGSSPQEIVQTVENLLISAKEQRKKRYSWHWFLTDINDYKPGFFQNAAQPDKALSVQDFYDRMKNDPKFKTALFLMNQKEWQKLGCPSGDEYYKLQDAWEVKNAS